MDDERLFHLSDAQWAQIEGAFPQRRGRSGFERKISNRLAFEAVLYPLVDSTVVRAHQRAAGARKKTVATRHLGVRVVV